MSRLLFVRHGQASLGKANYDQLSEQGFQQARWLGEYLAQRDVNPGRIILGELVRHRQTADAMCENLGAHPALEFHPGWNEFDFHRLFKAYLTQYPQQKLATGTPKEFFTVLRKAIKAWSDDQIEGEMPETWTEFEQRVRTALHDVLQRDDTDTVIVVSSGGAISMALKHILRLDNDALIDLNLQTRNTAITECYFNTQNIYLTSFNTVPHLDSPARQAHITHA